MRLLRRRGHVAAGIAAMLLALLLPLTVIAILDEPEPRVRVALRSDGLAALVDDGKARALVIATGDRELARALEARLSPPWQQAASTLVAPADDRVAPVVWDALLRGRARAIVIAGAPGANPLWVAIERECRAKGVTLTYVSGEAAIEMERLDARVVAPLPGSDDAPALVIGRDDTRLVIALGDRPPDIESHALVATRASKDASTTLVVLPSDVRAEGAASALAVDEREVVTLTVEPDAIRVAGGTLMPELERPASR